MVAVPAANGVTTPSATVATVSSLLDQSTTKSFGVVVAVIVPVAPAAVSDSVLLSRVMVGYSVRISLALVM